jgi:hypothetical protein
MPTIRYSLSTDLVYIGLAKLRRFRRILVTDSPTARPRSADVVVWLGGHEPPEPLGRGRLVVEPSSLHAAAVYIAAGPAEISLALAEPLQFMQLLADVSAAPALCAA